MIGETVSHYRIVEKIGSGGMGVVYKGEDVRLGRPVALKFLPHEFAQDRQSLERFQREARTASNLNHPHICTIYDIGSYEDQPFIVMELLEGRTLERQIGGKPLGIAESLETGIQIADALAAAHSNGVIHRDIKAANVFVTDRGHIKVLDFGLAKLIPYLKSPGESVQASALPTMEVLEEHLTRPGLMVGTVAYMSPEQASGEEVDQRTDLFSLGVVLYQMVTGTLPFRGGTIAVIFNEILSKTASSPAQLNPRVPATLEQVIKKALEKDRRFRYQSAEEMKAALVAIRRELETGIITSTITKSGAWKKQQSIAVLPFVNMSPDPEYEYFTEGLAEDLINALNKLAGLLVVSRTSAFQFRGKNYDIREAGRHLNVNTVLEGSVRKIGDRLRITAHLVNVSDGFELWSERYDREMKDVFSVQDEISRAIADALKIKLALDSDRRFVETATEDMEAYHLYLKGRFYWNKRSADALKKAIEHFQQAITRDPHYALAYSGLADSFILLAIHGSILPKEVWPKAKAAALKAIQIDDTVAAAHASLAHTFSSYDWNWTEAEKEYKRAIELSPNYATARHWYATNCLLISGRADEALVEVRRALELDPLSLIINSSLGGIHHLRREYDLAIEQFQRTIDLEPNFYFAHWQLGRSYVRKGLYDHAAAAFQKAIELSGGNPMSIGALAHLYITAEKTDQGITLMNELKRLSKQAYIPSIILASCYVALNDYEKAVDYLEKGYEERSAWLVWLPVEPSYDPLRSHPRFQALLSQMGLTDQVVVPNGH